MSFKAVSSGRADRTDLIERMARNNAEWCDAVCACHDAGGAFSELFWSTFAATPRYYPSLVTLTARGADAQMETIAALLASRKGIAVKDSFANLDLAPLGFRAVIEGKWIVHDQAIPANTGSDWRRIVDPDGLAAWEAAWGDGGARIFKNKLIERQSRIAIFACYRDEKIVAGCIANRDAGCVGLTNLFANSEDSTDLRAGAVERARIFADGLPLVAWAPTRELDDYASVGFRAIAPMRVWARAG